MDNPQHYQPLSHALHPPLAAGPQYSNFPSGSKNADKTPEQAEQEEGEEDDDEGMVEEQLDLQRRGSSPSSPRGDRQDEQQTRPAEPNGDVNNISQSQSHTQPDKDVQQKSEDDSAHPKRRPGRPRGSKNKTKPKPTNASTTKPTSPNNPSHSVFFQQSTAPTDVNAQNQQYYEFQWRVLNLCAEFYNAAEELVKLTPPLVIAQSYQMGPSIKVDPMTMLNDAKRICDTLLTDPSQLTTHPPPPMYPQISGFVVPQAPSAPGPSSSGSSTSKFSAKPSSVITNAQSFTLPLAAQGATHPQPLQYHPTYPPQAQGQYPTMPYYYTPPYAGASYAPISSAAPSMSPSAQPSIQQMSALGSSAGSQGAWTDEEQERLKELAEKSKSVGSTGNIEWDWVVHQWGSGRTRHQILIKATALGLKTSSSRGQKRRRETTHGLEEDGTPAPSTSATAPPSGVAQAATSTSPTISQPASANASPAIQNSRPPSQTPAAPSQLSWPAPVIAANAPSPITSAQPESPRTYYRARPTDKPDSLSSHHYVYHPNGKGSGGSKFSKQNGQ
jgi:hypothetical protein